MGVAKTITSAARILSTIAFASSPITHSCVLRQAKQPLQKLMLLSARLTFSTELPAFSAPRIKALARASEFPFFLRLVLTINTFFDIIISPRRVRGKRMLRAVIS